MWDRRFRVVDVAAQAGLSRASVDRALHQRPGVRPETVAQVAHAVQELERQRTLVQLSATTLLFDLVMQTHDRFAEAFVPVFERELRNLRPAVVRLRSHVQEHSDPYAAAAVLRSIARKGSSGLVLKAPDHPLVAKSVRELAAVGIPTVTFATDIAHSDRIAYVGVDNRAAGATAAYLITQWAQGCRGVLITYSNPNFLGEEERVEGFKRALATMAPNTLVREVRDTDGLDTATFSAVRKVLAGSPAIEAVYSVGGGNAAIVAAFSESGRPLKVFIGHDLDGDNRSLLRSERLSAILHHDLGADVRRICTHLLGFRDEGVPKTCPASPIQVITRYNEPLPY